MRNNKINDFRNLDCFPMEINSDTKSPSYLAEKEIKGLKRHSSAEFQIKNTNLYRSEIKDFEEYQDQSYLNGPKFKTNSLGIKNIQDPRNQGKQVEVKNTEKECESLKMSEIWTENAKIVQKILNDGFNEKTTDNGRINIILFENKLHTENSENIKRSKQNLTVKIEDFEKNNQLIPTLSFQNQTPISINGKIKEKMSDQSMNYQKSSEVLEKGIKSNMSILDEGLMNTKLNTEQIETAVISQNIFYSNLNSIDNEKIIRDDIKINAKTKTEKKINKISKAVNFKQKNNSKGPELKNEIVKSPKSSRALKSPRVLNSPKFFKKDMKFPRDSKLMSPSDGSNETNNISILKASIQTKISAAKKFSMLDELLKKLEKKHIDKPSTLDICEKNYNNQKNEDLEENLRLTRSFSLQETEEQNIEAGKIYHLLVHSFDERKLLRDGFFRKDLKGSPYKVYNILKAKNVMICKRLRLLRSCEVCYSL
jgi:hypothetical protein